MPQEIYHWENKNTNFQWNTISGIVWKFSIETNWYSSVNIWHSTARGDFCYHKKMQLVSWKKNEFYSVLILRQTMDNGYILQYWQLNQFYETGTICCRIILSEHHSDLFYFLINACHCLEIIYDMRFYFVYQMTIAYEKIWENAAFDFDRNLERRIDIRHAILRKSRSSR